MNWVFTQNPQLLNRADRRRAAREASRKTPAPKGAHKTSRGAHKTSRGARQTTEITGTSVTASPKAQASIETEAPLNLLHAAQPTPPPTPTLISPGIPGTIALVEPAPSTILYNFRDAPDAVHDSIREIFSQESTNDKISNVIDFINKEFELGSEAQARSKHLSEIFFKLFRILRHEAFDSKTFQLLKTLSNSISRLLKQNAYNDHTYASIALLFMGQPETKATYDLCISRIVKELRDHENRLSIRSFNGLAQLMKYAIDRSPELLEIGQRLTERMPQKPLNDKELEAALAYISSSKTEAAAQTLLGKIKPQLESKTSYQKNETPPELFFALMSIEKEDCTALAFQILEKFFTPKFKTEADEESIKQKLNNVDLRGLQRLLVGLRHFPRSIKIPGSIYEKFFKAISEKISSIKQEPKEDKSIACLGIMQEYTLIKQKFGENDFFTNLLRPLSQSSHVVHQTAERFSSAANKARRSRGEEQIRNILLSPEFLARVKTIDRRTLSITEITQPSSWFEQDIVFKVTPNYGGGASQIHINVEVDGEFIHKAKARSRFISEADRDAALLGRNPKIHTIRISTDPSQDLNEEAIINRVIHQAGGVKELMGSYWGKPAAVAAS